MQMAAKIHENCEYILKAHMVYVLPQYSYMNMVNQNVMKNEFLYKILLYQRCCTEQCTTTAYALIAPSFVR